MLVMLIGGTVLIAWAGITIRAYRGPIFANYLALAAVLVARRRGVGWRARGVVSTAAFLTFGTIITYVLGFAPGSLLCFVAAAVVATRILGTRAGLVTTLVASLI